MSYELWCLAFVSTRPQMFIMVNQSNIIQSNKEQPAFRRSKASQDKAIKQRQSADYDVHLDGVVEDSLLPLESATTTIFRVALPTGYYKVAEGDSIELLLHGESFSPAKVITLTKSDIAKGYVDYMLTKGDLAQEGAFLTSIVTYEGKAVYESLELLTKAQRSILIILITGFLGFLTCLAVTPFDVMSVVNCWLEPMNKAQTIRHRMKLEALVEREIAKNGFSLSRAPL
ncbi:hypothetical protein C0J08_08005 [Marinomonas sp. CT5]|uniref:hypothetical protein n=1 Tax=Marinomonas sp. CT5 TaxID=2066133 RepID=UPI001BAFD706|nr:hypothetical protein [Marinomonas sp. CT5]QUX95369.1 hypothetical protein C0J08_08005 [Marinomonas sp. CT5]